MEDGDRWTVYPMIRRLSYVPGGSWFHWLTVDPEVAPEQSSEDEARKREDDPQLLWVLEVVDGCPTSEDFF